MAYHPVELDAVLRTRHGHADLGAVDTIDADDAAMWLDRTVDAAGCLLGAAGFGLMLLDDRRELRRVGASDPGSWALQDAQLALRTGPDWDALTSGRSVAAADLGGTPRYGVLATLLAGTGVRAVLARPLIVAGECAGVFHFYRRRPAVWSDGEVSGATAFGGVLSAVLIQTVQSWRQAARVCRLRNLLDPFEVGQRR
jgi:GAF domain-containing protein